MAVYTEVSFEDLERLLAQYDIGAPLSFKGIAEGVENSNFYLQTDRGAFILTLYEKRVSADDLPFFLGLMEHLAARGLACPLPVQTRDGKRNGDAQRPRRRHPHLPERHLAAPARCRPLRGRRRAPWPVCMRRGDGFAMIRANALGPCGLAAAGRTPSHGADEYRGRAAASDHASSLDDLERGWPRDLPSGVIHADLFPDNVLFMRRRGLGPDRLLFRLQRRLRL